MCLSLNLDQFDKPSSLFCLHTSAELYIVNLEWQVFYIPPYKPQNTFWQVSAAPI